MVIAVLLLSFGGSADRRGSRGCASPARTGFAVVADRDIIGRRRTFVRQRADDWAEWVDPDADVPFGRSGRGAGRGPGTGLGVPTPDRIRTRRADRKGCRAGKECPKMASTPRRERGAAGFEPPDEGRLTLCG
ncbi:hypothetical protein CAE01nite_15160 [Cellulomonas aerilata]|uniref:Uncharacterized protein n=1 Tax=Cellulomonas aerilata TaxID=515326 RepID=A0A512DBD9_9CELL|nr:hypothetical protein CAE01nite_15160 [Cellulomonas aerilata]